MIPASAPVHRSAAAKLLAVSREGVLRHMARSEFASLLRSGDLIVANDAATLPASLSGRHLPSGEAIEVRLAGRASLAGKDVRHFSAVVFGSGDFRMRTEDRPLPPKLHPGDGLELGPLRATVTSLLNHSRLISLQFAGAPSQIWEGISRHGRPIQYAHVPNPIAVWDTWTAIAGAPVAFEPPSAGFLLDWSMLGVMLTRRVRFATLTHAAGISSTGDATLDALLPFDEPYYIPESTARAITDAKASGGRVIAIGTTVVRALEHAAAPTGIVRIGANIATQQIGARTRLRVVDAIVSGTHEPGTSHYELLRAFIPDSLLQRIDTELERRQYRTHEFGDSVFLEADSIGPLLGQHGEAQQRVAGAHYQVLDAIQFVGNRGVAHSTS